MMLGNTSSSMNRLEVWPTRNGPHEPQACCRWNMVSPALAPIPYRSNSNWVLTSPSVVGRKPLTPNLDCRTLKVVNPFVPQPASVPTGGQFTGILEGRKAADQVGSICLVS